MILSSLKVLAFPGKDAKISSDKEGFAFTTGMSHNEQETIRILANIRRRLQCKTEYFIYFKIGKTASG